MYFPAVSFTPAILCELLVNLCSDAHPPPPPPLPPPPLYSRSPTSTHLLLPSEIWGEVRTRLALVAVLYSVTAAALISPAVWRLASGANITALCCTLLTPHELNMDEHLIAAAYQRLSGEL